MNKNIEELFPIAGILFIILGLLAYYQGFQTSGLASILWFSYTTLILVGIGILIKNPYLIASQINIIFIPYIVWNIDFFYVLLTGNNLLGLTNYFFTPRPLLSQIITLQHLFIIPVSILALYFMRLKRKDFWKISFMQVILFFFLIRILNPEENINCIFQNCLPFGIQIVPYEVTWFTSYIIMILFTNFLLVKIFHE